MSKIYKAVQLLVNDVLPDDIKNYQRKYNTKDIKELLTNIAEKYPDQYADIVQNLTDVGRNLAFYSGETITLNDLKPTFDKDKEINELTQKAKIIRSTIKNKEERSKALAELYGAYASKLEDMTMKYSTSNNLYNSVSSGARGNPSQLKAMITTPALYTDSTGKPINLFIKHSFGQGLTPEEFLASTFGTRSATVTIKRGTAEAGGLGKELNRSSANIIITSKKDLSGNGIDMDIDDPEIEGRVLARDVAGVKQGTILDRDIISYLKTKLKGNCLAKNTKVKMADGSSKNIQDIQIGDKVLAFDIKNQKEVLANVVNTYAQGFKKCKEYTILNGKFRTNIVCTKNHKFLTIKNNKFYKHHLSEKDINQLLVTNIFYNENKSEKTRLYAIIEHVDILKDLIECYDIEIDHPDHLFILANGLITSNSNKTILVHSPIATVSAEGIPAEAFGISYTRKLPPIGFSAGMTASNALMEPVTQGSLCLYEDTLVRMSDLTIKPIKYIKVGEEVLGSDIQGNTFAVKVVNKFKQGYKDINRYYFCKKSDPKHIISVDCTKDHKFLVQKISSIKNTFNILPIGANEKFELQTVNINKNNEVNYIKYEKLNSEYLGKKHCYDIEIDHPDHLFILANGLITSNSSKHTAGSFSKKKNIAGLSYLQQFLQSPENFKDRAAVSEIDGTVENIEKAPQGGNYIIINGQKHYVLPDIEIYVKKGDKVEAGDILSDGLADPEDIVRTRGLGEGRRYFAERLKKLLDDSKAPASLRNTEVVARNALDKVEITDPNGLGDYLPSDIVSYNKIEASYVPRDNSKLFTINKENEKNLLNKYLEKPVLHYTIGTRITPKILQRLQKAQIPEILVNDDKPGFEPVMIRLRENSVKGSDSWIANANASYLQRGFIEAASKGLDAPIKESINPFARLWSADFGKNIETSGKF